MTLTEFLNARIAEDEAVARVAVIPAHDGYKPHPELASWHYEPDGEVEYVQTAEMLAHQYAERIYVTMDGEGIRSAVDEEVGPHIARHDPARVLAECEAKRRIINMMDDPRRDTYEIHEVLAVLALPYADHPDYDPAWRT